MVFYDRVPVFVNFLSAPVKKLIAQAPFFLYFNKGIDGYMIFWSLANE